MKTNIQSIKTRQRQSTIVNPKLIQSMNILQLSNIDLLEIIKTEEEENPLISVDWAPTTIERGCIKPKNDIQKSKISGEDFYGENHLDFRETLKMDLVYLNLNKIEKACAEYIIDSLEDNGLLLMDETRIADEFGISQKDVKNIIEKLKTLEPAGIFAQSLQECLILQMERSPINTTIASIIVKNHFNDLIKNRIESISKKIKIEKKRVSESINYIKSLNPTPSNAIKCYHESNWIIPDLYVNINGNSINIGVNNSLIPQISINSAYASTLPNNSDEIKEYIKTKSDRIKHIKNCIDKRNKTLVSITHEIVRVQKKFFSQGNTALKPLRLIDIAKNLGIHKSTVSRAIKNKYIECNRGIFPLSFFLQKTYIDENGSKISAGKIKTIIQNILKNESPNNPYSDQEISDKLAKKSILISRRTVCKYRKQLGYSARFQRRRYDC